MKISACVDCGTSIIGERLRCPACHDRHAANFEPEIGTETVASPRAGSALRILLPWLVAAEMIAAVVAGIAIAVRGC